MARERPHTRGTRIALGLVGAVVALALAAALLFPALVPLEAVHAALERRAESALHRRVDIGELHLRLLPRPQLRARDVVVHSHRETAPLLRVESLELHVRLRPLLRRQVEVTEVALRDGAMTLVRERDGAFDIKDLVEGEPGGRLEVKRVVLDGIALTVRDLRARRGAEVTTTVEVDRARLQQRARDGAYRLDAVITALDGPAGNVQVSGRVGPLGEGALPLELDVEGEALAVAGLEPYAGRTVRSAPVRVDVRMSATGDARRRLELEGEVAAGRGLRASFEGSAAELADEAVLDVRVRAPALPLSDLVAALPEVQARLPRPAVVDGSLAVRAHVQGTLGALVASGQATGFAPRVRVGEGQSRLEADDVRADLRLRGVQGQPPRVEGTVEAERFSFDRPPDAGPEPRAPPAIFVSVQLSAAAGRLLDLEYEGLEAPVRYDAGELRAEPSFTAHGGRWSGTLRSSLGAEPERHRLQARVKGAAAAPLVAALADVGDVLRGTLDADFTVSWRGPGWDAFTRTASGSGVVDVADPELPTLALDRRLASALRAAARAAGLVFPARLELPPLEDMRAEVRITDGRLHTDGLRVWGEGAELLARGSLGFDRTLRYDGTLRLEGASARALGPLAPVLQDDDGKVTLPFRLGGTVREPHVMVDPAALVRRGVVGMAGEAARHLFDAFSAAGRR